MSDPIPCRIDGCERASTYRGKRLCKLHYGRLARTGTPDARQPIPNVVRFEARIAAGPGECWTWTGNANRADDGYGTMALVGRTVAYAHRWSYEYHVAPIPDGLELDHLCRNTLCVNPWHLEPVTPRENHARIPFAPATHCKRGHERTAQNVAPNGNCIECRPILYAASRARLSA